jgi:ATP-dependent DNA ligase
MAAEQIELRAAELRGRPRMGARAGLGELFVGYYDGERLANAGKVGNGCTRETLDQLAERLCNLERREPAFAENDVPAGGSTGPPRARGADRLHRSHR